MRTRRFLSGDGYYSQAIDFLLFFHETEEEKEQRLEAMQKADQGAGQHLLPPSVSIVVGACTGNDSWFTGGGHMGFFKQGRIRYLGGGGWLW